MNESPGVNVEVFTSAGELRDRGFRLYDPPLLISGFLWALTLVGVLYLG